MILSALISLNQNSKKIIFVFQKMSNSQIATNFIRVSSKRYFFKNFGDVNIFGLRVKILSRLRVWWIRANMYGDTFFHNKINISILESLFQYMQSGPTVWFLI